VSTRPDLRRIVVGAVGPDRIKRIDFVQPRTGRHELTVMDKIRLSDWLVIVLLVLGALLAAAGLVRAQEQMAVDVAVNGQRLTEVERRVAATENRQEDIFYALLAQLGASGVQVGLSVKKRERRS
jgi:hypothetical protein